MTARDRTVLLALAVLAVIGGAWMLVLAPAREDGRKLDAEVTAARTTLQAAQALVAGGEEARNAYRADYATVAQLGKAVPADDDVPSFVVQLEAAADRSKADFRSLELAVGTGAAAPTVAAPPAAPATGTTGATGATGPSAVPAASPAAAVATLPPGATVGSAGFPTMPFDLSFTGSFSHLQDLLQRLDRFTQLDGPKITVRGRLMTVDGFALKASPKGFPNMKASVRATTYILPADEASGAGGTADAAAPSVTLAAPATSTGADAE